MPKCMFKVNKTNLLMKERLDKQMKYDLKKNYILLITVCRLIKENTNQTQSVQNIQIIFK